MCWQRTHASSYLEISPQISVMAMKCIANVFLLSSWQRLGEWIGLGRSEKFPIRELVLHYKTPEVEPKEKSCGPVILYCLQQSSSPRRLLETLWSERDTRDDDCRIATQWSYTFLEVWSKPDWLFECSKLNGRDVFTR